jgi:hypothetical protein
MAEVRFFSSSPTPLQSKQLVCSARLCAVEFEPFLDDFLIVKPAHLDLSQIMGQTM